MLFSLVEFFMLFQRGSDVGTDEPGVGRKAGKGRLGITKGELCWVLIWSFLLYWDTENVLFNLVFTSILLGNRVSEMICSSHVHVKPFNLFHRSSNTSLVSCP